MPDLDFVVDRASEVPLGTQLIWKLRTLIATGLLSPGDRLPGIREVAEAAGVNVNTVRSVFARLEDQGLLASEHGRGTFVAPGVRRAKILADMASAALAQAREAGIDPRELATVLYVSPASTTPPATKTAVADERAHRRALRAEIVELEREIAALDPLGTLETPRDAPTPRLLSATELRETRAQLMARLEELRRERQEWRQEQAQQRELDEAEQPAEARPRSRWREGGIWTGRPDARVSWTTP